MWVSRFQMSPPLMEQRYIHDGTCEGPEITQTAENRRESEGGERERVHDCWFQPERIAPEKVKSELADHT